jgi:hypothetical protein
MFWSKKGENEDANFGGSTFWWIDREAGVAGVVFLNMLPYMDTEAVLLWKDFQMKVYDTLNEK